MSTNNVDPVLRWLENYAEWSAFQAKVSADEDEGQASSSDWHRSDDWGVELAEAAHSIIRRLADDVEPDPDLWVKAQKEDQVV